jgi:hypothetical protein
MPLSRGWFAGYSSVVRIGCWLICLQFNLTAGK